ncbi:MAG: energy-coupling factor transporter ATPase [Candidatus Promineifilaceae bacterium]|nr:energy-coupling factor transporter ATPase [Candidatus Promineifilaceae bacterium]
MIHIADLNYRYPGRTRSALRSVSLDVEAGEFVLIAGPSGAGKSTLLRCLNGLVPHFSGGLFGGMVEVNGVSAVHDGPSRLSKLVGFVFQSPETQAVLDTVEAEVAFGLENAGVPQQQMRLRVDEVLNLLELADVRDRKLTSLSGGERQRVAIAAALALRPRVLALDEPTSQLDPQAAESVLESLRRLNEELGLTILLVEQRLERVVRHADRLVFMEAGTITVDGPLRQALSRISPAYQPPLAKLGSELGIDPVPITVKDGLRELMFDGRAAKATAPQPRTNGRRHEILLQAKNIGFSYGGRAVLHGVNLEVRAGETVVVVGRNGAGKSTLARCLVGLLAPGQGKVYIEGRSTHGRRVAEICRDVAYLPQSPDDLLFAESVSEELTITLDNHGLMPEQVNPGPAELLKALGLEEVVDRYPRDLSVGQRQRVALGSVIVHGPKLLILDEPTRGLDYVVKQRLVDLLARWKEAGKGTLLVTHDVELAAEVADRVTVLSDGRVLASGVPAEVLRASSLFTPQIARMFPQTNWLTVGDVLAELEEDRSDGSVSVLRMASEVERP